MQKSYVNDFVKNIEKARNTTDMLNFYSDLESFLKTIEWSEVRKVANFPVLSFRQKISSFLERYELYKMIKEIPGSILECGVADGFGLMSFAHFCSIFEGNHYARKVIGFDTFEGFTELSAQDRISKAEHMTKGGLEHQSLEILQKMIEFYDRNRPLGHLQKVVLCKGDISKTLPEYLEKHPYLVVSLLYLDLDLYKPTKDATRLLFDRIPKGGLICFDEINHEDYPGETMAVMEEIGISKLRLKRFNFSSRLSYAIIE